MSNSEHLHDIAQRAFQANVLPMVFKGYTPESLIQVTIKKGGDIRAVIHDRTGNREIATIVTEHSGYLTTVDTVRYENDLLQRHEIEMISRLNGEIRRHEVIFDRDEWDQAVQIERGSDGMILAVISMSNPERMGAKWIHTKSQRGSAGTDKRREADHVIRRWR